MADWAAVLLLLVLPQSAPGVDDQKVASAIERGIAWLRQAPSPGCDLSKKKLPSLRNSDDLLLLTFLHAGVPEDDPKIRELLAAALAAPLTHVYPVSLRAMALEELDRVRYQSPIARCAQFLVDNQFASGQWGYGEPSPAADGMGAETASASTPRPLDKNGLRSKPKVVRKVVVKQTRVPAGIGDFSNTQYAALGLRAAHDAGVVLPKDGVARAVKALAAAQQAGPPPAGGPGPNLPSGRKARGWCYDHPCACPLHRPYGTMTAGSVGALAIFEYILGRDWKRNTAVLDGLAWLQVHYTVETVPGPIEWDGITKTTYLSYYLYALERTGILTGNEKFGTHPWYADGVRVLLDSQKPNGSWAVDDWGNETWDTCFALLFLRRSTRPLVPSTDRVVQRDDDQ